MVWVLSSKQDKKAVTQCETENYKKFITYSLEGIFFTNEKKLPGAAQHYAPYLLTIEVKLSKKRIPQSRKNEHIDAEMCNIS